MDGSVACTDSTISRSERAVVSTFGSRMEVYVKTTSSALSGVPSWKVTPERRWAVTVLPSADTSGTGSASPGATALDASRATRPSKISEPPSGAKFSTGL